MRTHALFAVALPAAGRVTATGTVIGVAANQPIPNATVMDYSAATRHFILLDHKDQYRVISFAVKK